MKRIAIIIAIIICVSLIAGCGTKIESVEADLSISIPSRFVEVYYCNGGGYDSHYINVDTETEVMYWYITDTYRSALTVMLNADGSPMRYDLEEHKIIEEKGEQNNDTK